MLANPKINLQTDWKMMAINSHFQTAEAAQILLQQGQTEEAKVALNALVEAMSRSERQALKSQLTRLMMHIIKWQTQPNKRSRSWIVSILDARDAIEESQEEMPSLNREFIESLWAQALIKANRKAEAEMNCKSSISSLTWKEVFEDDYLLD
jgi:Tfp pilus assembly pilus retraction ATPase PilT